MKISINATASFQLTIHEKFSEFSNLPNVEAESTICVEKMDLVYIHSATEHSSVKKEKFAFWYTLWVTPYYILWPT